MSTQVSILVVVALFLVVGKAADVLVLAARSVSRKLGIGMTTLGVLLGLATNLPELGIGLSSIQSETPELAIGNLLGGALVLFGFILGTSLVLEKKVETDGKMIHVLPALVYNLIPTILIVSGAVVDRTMGLALIATYPLVVYVLTKTGSHTYKHITDIRRVEKDIILFLLGLLVIVVGSKYIVDITLVVLNQYSVSHLIVGALLFSVGTSLPELIITIEAWRKNAKSLSVANLIGSAAGQALVLGVLGTIKPLSLSPGGILEVILIAKVVMFSMVAYFYAHGRTLTRKEGIALLLVFAAALAGYSGSL